MRGLIFILEEDQILTLKGSAFRQYHAGLDTQLVFNRNISGTQKNYIRSVYHCNYALIHND